jgi:hypothetical protein
MPQADSGAPPSVAAGVVLRAQAARSLIAALLAAVLGVAVDGADVGVLAASAGAVIAALGAWALWTRDHRRRRLMDGGREWRGELPRLLSSGAVLRRALLPLPLAVALIWAGSQASRLYADDTGVLLGALAGLVASLGSMRILLAGDLASWERTSGREVLLSEVGVRSTTTVWSAPARTTADRKGRPVWMLLVAGVALGAIAWGAVRSLGSGEQQPARALLVVGGLALVICLSIWASERRNSRR